MKRQFPELGVGVGLRSPHYEHILEERPKSFRWFEVISENFMAWQNHPVAARTHMLTDLRKDYNVAMHGVGLSIGGTDPLNQTYLKNLKQLIEVVEPVVVSDHLCWTGVEGLDAHDLLPLPYTEEALHHVVERVKKVQDFLGRRILLENPSSYLEFTASHLREDEFLAELAERADCGLLLDINNVYVSSTNHGLDAKKYLQTIPHHRVGQIHLAGHSTRDGYLIDTHDHDVCEPVWDLYSWYSKNYGTPSTMLERDDHIPPWADVEKELGRIHSTLGEVQNAELA